MQPDRFARKIVPFLTLPYAARSRRLKRKPLGGWGSMVGIPFWLQESLSDVRARCAKLVVQAWFDGSWCGLSVMPGVIVCWA